MANDVTIQDQTNLQKDVVPSFLGEMKGATGFEGVTSDCISIPFLRLAQSNTPQVLPGKDKLQGLEGGMYFNPGTGRIYSDPSFIILGFFRTWTVWNGQPPNAKFVKSLTHEDYTLNHESKTHRGEVEGKTLILDDEGNRYVDTRNFLVLSSEHPEDGILLYAMAATGIPASKKWLAKASAVRVRAADGSMVQAPMWSRIWKLKTQFEEKPKGKYWQVGDIQDSGWIPAAIAPTVQAMFDEAQGYDKARIGAVEKAAAPDEDDAPEWAK